MFQSLSHWFQSNIDPLFERYSDLSDEPLPPKQVSKIKEAVRRKKDSVKIYGDLEEPLVIVSQEELDEFDLDRSPQAIYHSILGFASGCFHQLNVLESSACQAPSDQALMQLITRSRVSLLLKPVKHEKPQTYRVQTSPYQHMTTLDKTMKVCGAYLDVELSSMKNESFVCRSEIIKRITLLIPGKYMTSATPGLVKFSVTEQNLAWNAAKLLFMHNINHELVLHQHPCLHVTATSICHLTRQCLPQADHVLRRFLDPHFKYTLAVTSHVINDAYSILLQHASPFSPFDIDFKTMNTFHLQKAHRKLLVNLDNPFVQSPGPGTGSDPLKSLPYSKMMNEYYQVIQNWTETFAGFYLQGIEKESIVQKWFLALRNHFGHRHFKPWKTSRKLTRPLMIQLLTSILFMVTVQHSSDHWLYAQIPVKNKPWRWRGALPQHKDDDQAQANLDSYDQFQEHAANHMFFTNVPQTPLYEIEYRDCPLNTSRLFEKLQKIYHTYELVPPHEISVSIDW